MSHWSVHPIRILPFLEDRDPDSLPKPYPAKRDWPPEGGGISSIYAFDLRSLACALVLLMTLAMTTGCELLFKPDPQLGDEAPNSYTCQCTGFISGSGSCGLDDAACTFDSDCMSGTCSNDGSACSSDADCPGSNTCVGIGTDVCIGTTSFGPKDFNACVTDDLNPNLGGVKATDANLDSDCSSRVRDIVLGIVQQCAAEDLVEVVCDGAPASSQKFFPRCDEECVPELLSGDGANCDIANITVDTQAQDPVCLSEDGSILGVAGPLGVAAALRSRSTCNVMGDVIIDTNLEVDNDEKVEPAQGVVEFIGEPCPGQNCNIGMFSRIDEVGTFSFGGFFGFASTKISNIRAIGSSLSTAMVNPDGTATFDNTLASGRGRRRDLLKGGIETNDESKALVAINTDPIDVNVDWTGLGGSCMVDGALLGQIENSDASVSARLEGEIVNEPPSAHAGGDRTVECTSPAGAMVTLDATGSTDPQDNIVVTQWRLGELTGPELGALQEVVQVPQALGTEDYVVNVMDDFWQISTDIATVRVVDTSTPEISCNAPATIDPTDAPISFTATATDVCDASLSSPSIAAFDCFTLTKKGKRIDKTDSCEVALDGDTITILDSGGVGDVISWTVNLSDASGNNGAANCETVVGNPSQ